MHFFSQSIFLIYCHPHVIVPLLFLLVRRTRSPETQQTSRRSFKTGEKSVRRNNESVIVCGLHLQHHSLFGSCLVVASCAPVVTLIYNKGGDMDSVPRAFGCYFSRWPQQIISLHLILSLASSFTSACHPSTSTNLLWDLPLSLLLASSIITFLFQYIHDSSSTHPKIISASLI